MSNKRQYTTPEPIPTVEAFQTDLGLVRIVENEQWYTFLLTNTEVGRLARLPGKWGTKGHQMHLLAEAAGLVLKVNGKWVPTEKGMCHAKKVDGRWRWYPSMVGLIEEAAKQHDLTELKVAYEAYTP